MVRPQVPDYMKKEEAEIKPLHVVRPKEKSKDNSDLTFKLDNRDKRTDPNLIKRPLHA